MSCISVRCVRACLHGAAGRQPGRGPRRRRAQRVVAMILVCRRLNKYPALADAQARFIRFLLHEDEKKTASMRCRLGQGGAKGGTSARADPGLLGQLAETFAIVSREATQVAEAELESGVGDVGIGLREQAFARGVEADIA